MKVSEIVSLPYVKVGLAVFAALVVWRFMDVIWFAIVVGVLFALGAVAWDFVKKSGGPLKAFEKAWAWFRETFKVDLT